MHSLPIFCMQSYGPWVMPLEHAASGGAAGPSSGGALQGGPEVDPASAFDALLAKDAPAVEADPQDMAWFKAHFGKKVRG